MNTRQLHVKCTTCECSVEALYHLNHGKGVTMNKSILRLPQVMARTGLSRSTIYLRISKGQFPRPISLGGRAVGWIEEEIDRWLEEQIKASRMV